MDLRFVSVGVRFPFLLSRCSFCCSVLLGVLFAVVVETPPVGVVVWRLEEGDAKAQLLLHV